MKHKKWTWGVLFLLSLLLLAILFFVNWNTLLLFQMDNTFTSAINNNNDIALIETQSVCGKLNGNGNGIQFFGAALITTQSKTDLDLLVQQLSSKYDIVQYAVQTGSKIETTYLEHASLQFDSDASNIDGAYIVYYYNSTHYLSNDWDLVGH